MKLVIHEANIELLKWRALITLGIYSVYIYILQMIPIHIGEVKSMYN